MPKTGFQSFAGEKLSLTHSHRGTASNQPNVHVSDLSVNPGEKLCTTCAEEGNKTNGHRIKRETQLFTATLLAHPIKEQYQKISLGCKSFVVNYSLKSGMH